MGVKLMTIIMLAMLAIAAAQSVQSDPTQHFVDDLLEEEKVKHPVNLIAKFCKAHPKSKACAAFKKIVREEMAEDLLDDADLTDMREELIEESVDGSWGKKIQKLKNATKKNATNAKPTPKATKAAKKSSWITKPTPKATKAAKKSSWITRWWKSYCKKNPASKACA